MSTRKISIVHPPGALSACVLYDHNRRRRDGWRYFATFPDTTDREKVLDLCTLPEKDRSTTGTVYRRPPYILRTRTRLVFVQSGWVPLSCCRRRRRGRLSLRAEGWLVAGLAALAVLAVELLPDLVAGWIF